MARIREIDLLLPALYIIGREAKPNTTKIKQILIDVFQPSGEDSERLAGRKDTKFTQIVRNLLGSHYDSNGMSELTLKDSNGRFTLTGKGEEQVKSNIDFLEYLFGNRFYYEDALQISNSAANSRGKKRKLYVYPENDEISEGKLTVKQTKIKERSRKLREAALTYHSHNGRIACTVCGFDFEETYGDLGREYIQIHHEKPIYQYSDEGFSQYMHEAVRYMKPLCANCHCMIHRFRGKALTIEELKAIIKKTSRD